MILILTRGKQQAPSSLFLAFVIVLRSSYMMIHSSSTSFSAKIFRLTDSDMRLFFGFLPADIES